MKSLKQLIDYIAPKLVDCAEHIVLADLQLDSRQIKPADVFIAMQGLHHHGLDYLQQAHNAGAVCVLADRDLTQNEQACLNSNNSTITVCVVENLETRLADLANWFYDQPSKKLKVVGITGTNGKTSTAHYLAGLLLQLDQQPALIGTLGNGLITSCEQEILEKTANTTPDVVSVFRLLNQFYQQGANWVVMEVSSHALALGRVAGLEFEAVALTQVTRDHLDFHGSEANYCSTKATLFTDYPSKMQIVNAQDTVGQNLLQSGKLSQPFAYSVQPDDLVNLQCVHYRLHESGIDLDLRYKSLSESNSANPENSQNQQACLNLIGAFNIENALCAMSVLIASGFNWQTLVTLLPSLNAVKGRMHKVATEPTVIVDFAHTPDALQQVLLAIKSHTEAFNNRLIKSDLAQKKHTESQVWVVFGCGGDRDQGKRPLMAQVAERFADCVVLTSDNPRFESPDDILTDTLNGFNAADKIQIIQDRKKAIEYALNHAHPKDVVLIAGKGHENYQDIAGIKQPFSDQQVVLDWVSKQIRDGDV